MLKYTDAIVTFSEFPNEISLCINISGCPNNCIGCHSPYLSEDIGEILDEESLKKLIQDNNGISCVGLLGGDQDPSSINTLASFIKKEFPNIKVGWYSGKSILAKEIDLNNFDFYKLGPYIKEYGPLNSPTTNQVFYSRGKYLNKIDTSPNMWYNVTNWFWNGTR